MTELPASEQVDKDYDPFLQIRSRTLLWWTLGGFFPLLIAAVACGDPFLDSEVGYLLVIPSVFSAVWLLWVLRQVQRHRLNLKRLLGVIPAGYSWGSAFGLIPLLYASSLGSFGLIAYWLSGESPAYVEELLQEPVLLSSQDTRSDLPFNALIVTLGVLIAPVVEELLFRGILLHRWSAKWGVTRAVWTSSVVFGLLHFEAAFGAILFGFVMATLYIESHSLFVPIVLHIANNAIAYGLVGLESLAPAWMANWLTFWSTVEGLQQDIWIAAICLAASTPWAVYYVLRHRPRNDGSLPYSTTQSKTPGTVQT